jgi:hypothetical protein
MVRVADDVDGVQLQRLDEPGQRVERGQHWVSAEVVTDPEAGEFQDQTTEVLSESR